MLPLIIQAAGEGPQMFAIPPDAVLEVPLTHPSYPWFTDLGLRWHAVPVISDMFLTAGGIRYPCAPFNGWYMGTEVGSRNLGDTGRYNKCPTVARHMGLNMSTERSLWRNRALVELNTAVLHSLTKPELRSPTITPSLNGSSPTCGERNARDGCAPRTGAGSFRPWQAPHAAYSIATTTTQTCGPVSTGTHRRLRPTCKARIHKRH